jgi:hypothetical protein
MPTHQGTSQTDIVISGGGSKSMTLDGRFAFDATYGTSANFQYKDNAPSQNNEDSNYELKILNVAGATIATFAAEYTVDLVAGSGTTVNSTRTNTFNPSPNGNTPTFPSLWATHATRDWSISSTHSGSAFGTFTSAWKFASTVVSGGSVSYAVNTQNNDELNVTLTYSDGTSTILTVVVTCYAKATVAGGVQLGSVSRTDNLQP